VNIRVADGAAPTVLADNREGDREARVAVTDENKHIAEPKSLSQTRNKQIVESKARASGEVSRSRYEDFQHTIRSIGPPIHYDVILPMREPYMQQIVTGEKTYEFRKYCLKPSIERIWFYRTAPHSSIEYICEILPARTRNPGDHAIKEDGLGNREFHTRHKDWEGYDFAYKILSVWKIEKPVIWRI